MSITARTVNVPRSFWADLLILSLFFVFLYYFVGAARFWTGTFTTVTEIDLSPWALPKYSFFSLVRNSISYILSLIFTLIIGYIAGKSRTGELLLIPFLDIGQSIPVFGFLPTLVVGLVAAFPNNIGLELTCIIMIFTSQVWNMAFSFHGSLRALPESYKELGNLAGLNWFGKLIRIELPFSAIGLAWNSLMSMAGGWFFLVVCESFTLGEQNFRLPGIGSYMAVAIEQNNRPAMLYGCGAMFLLIIFVDFFVWRPVLAWTSKFKSDDFSTEAEPIPFMTLLLKDSWLVSVLQNINDTIGPGKWIELLSKDSYPTLTDSKPNTRKSLEWRRLRVFRKKRLKLTLRNKALLRTILSRGSIIITIIVLLWGFTRLWELIRLLNFKDWQNIFAQAGFSMVRVFLAVAISTIWTVPFGIWVGLSPRLTRFFQPLVQIAASFPAPMIFPLVMLVMDRAGIAFGIWPIILIVLGVQWYILFNVLAGATNMPRELKDCVDMMGIKGFRKWFRFYIPSIFPHLVTGWMTAAGGAWNATIVTEIVQYQGKTLVAQGLGSLIAQATAKADFPLLSGALIVMVAAVISINRLVWLKLINIAESKFER